MDALFSHLTLTDVHRDVFRNIVSIRSSQNLFDDLSDSVGDWLLAQQVEDAVKPPPYQSRTPVIHRPFEDAEWFNAIGWPFKHWQISRFSDGQFGVWYGSDSVETTAFETAYHWMNGFLTDAGFQKENVTCERKLYAVACDVALVDLRPLTKNHSGLVHKADYSYSQSVGARLHREGHPGLVTVSVRNPGGHNFVVLNPNVLSNVRFNCHLTYHAHGGQVLIEKEPDIVWLKLDPFG